MSSYVHHVVETHPAEFFEVEEPHTLPMPELVQVGGYESSLHLREPAHPAKMNKSKIIRSRLTELLEPAPLFQKIKPAEYLDLSARTKGQSIVRASIVFGLKNDLELLEDIATERLEVSEALLEMQQKLNQSRKRIEAMPTTIPDWLKNFAADHGFDHLAVISSQAGELIEEATRALIAYEASKRIYLDYFERNLHQHGLQLEKLAWKGETDYKAHLGIKVIDSRFEQNYDILSEWINKHNYHYRFYNAFFEALDSADHLYTHYQDDLLKEIQAPLSKSSTDVIDDDSSAGNADRVVCKNSEDTSDESDSEGDDSELEWLSKLLPKRPDKLELIKAELAPVKPLKSFDELKAEVNSGMVLRSIVYYGESNKSGTAVSLFPVGCGHKFSKSLSPHITINRKWDGGQIFHITYQGQHHYYRIISSINSGFVKDYLQSTDYVDIGDGRGKINTNPRRLALEEIDLKVNELAEDFLDFLQNGSQVLAFNHSCSAGHISQTPTTGQR